jgi:hypothetical protein
MANLKEVEVIVVYFKMLWNLPGELRSTVYKNRSANPSTVTFDLNLLGEAKYLTLLRGSLQVFPPSKNPYISNSNFLFSGVINPTSSK